RPRTAAGRSLPERPAQSLNAFSPEPIRLTASGPACRRNRRASLPLAARRTRTATCFFPTSFLASGSHQILHQLNHKDTKTQRNAALLCVFVVNPKREVLPPVA